MPELVRHRCLVYDGDPAEQAAAVVPLFVDALREKHRCLYIGGAPAVGLIWGALADRGVDPEAEAARGALVFSSERATGAFDPKAMLARLRALVEDAVRDGFSGLCATGDMRFELGEDDASFERLLEYEAGLDRAIQDLPLRGICQYNRGSVPARAVREALATHREVFIGRDLHRDNLFYVPPELHSAPAGAGTSDRVGDWMWRQIERVARAERQRDAAESALSEANRRLEQRVSERTAELEAVIRELEAFNYSVSHDLGAPLRAIAGFSDIIARRYLDRLDEEGKSLFERVASAADRMRQMTSGLLELSRIGGCRLERKTVDLSAQARTVVDELRAGGPEREVECVIAPDLKAQGDPRLVAVVLQNLLGNAWKFTAKTPKPRVEVGSKVGAGGPVYFVRDNGVGFEMSEKSRLFEPFVRLHADEYPGHGIGLATVARVVARHGGRVWAESKPGEGAVFFFTLPSGPDPS